mmetsp:Transcript_21508/g.45257  ORF Transcript_21508/g.45257 Transcript_21508/m.45257 type:complete len:523 (-) Transcript_21508:205-1773(-)
MRRFSGVVDGLRCGPRRVVVTGIGTVSPLGNTLDDTWKQIVGDNNDCNSNSGRIFGAISLEETLAVNQDLSPDQFEREWSIARSLPCQVVAPVRGLKEAFLEDDANADKVNGSSHWNPRTTARFVQMALLAGSQAMRQANLVNWLDNGDKNGERGVEALVTYASNHRRDRFGVCVGSGMSAVREITSAWDIVDGGKIRKLSPHFIPKVLTNSASGRLSLEYGLRGPNLAPSTACAASAHAIGDAVRTIRSGAADLMLAGGAEASIEPLGLAGFCRLRALSTLFNDTPQEASRPFDTKRDGFVMGEGAAIMVLEELEHAKERIRKNDGDERTTTRILAEVTGYAATGDAFHVTAPDEAGRGAERAMTLALEEDSYLSNNQFPIGYINAHATSTPKGDEIEAAVVDRVLRSSKFNKDSHSACYMSSTKGATGHLLGAAGALEAAFTVMSLVDQRIPPTLNLSGDANVDSSSANSPLFTHVAGDKGIQLTTDIEIAISNSFGFGGTNASLVFRRYKDDRNSEKET